MVVAVTNDPQEGARQDGAKSERQNGQSNKQGEQGSTKVNELKPWRTEGMPEGMEPPPPPKWGRAFAWFAAI